MEKILGAKETRTQSYKNKICISMNATNQFKAYGEF